MWHQFDSAQACANALVADIRFLLEKTLIEKDHAVMAVSGGPSPVLMFQTLSRVAIEWDKVHIVLVDERYVPSDHPDSNERLVREHLLQNHAASARFTGLAYQTDTLDDDVQYANKHIPPADLVVLGMGNDGHIASLFPHARQLPSALDPDRAPTKPYIHISPPDAAHERISLTLSALQKAPCLILEIQGATKREVFERASMSVSNDYPVSHLLSRHWRGPRVQIYWHP